MSDNQDQQVSNQISIEDLQLSLQVYQIQSDQKLHKLKTLFDQKKTLDLRQVFYQQRSSIQVKFQNIIGDLTEFLINQEVPSTEKLRKTFYRILQSPLLLLFKVSRFQIFNLRLNAFDIQLEPIEAICELATLLYKNIDEYVSNQKTFKTDFNNSIYQSYQQFLSQAKINLISDQIFILYSYLRKGSNILKKKVQDKIKVIEIFNKIQEKLINTLIKNQDVKTLKQLSALNYQIYLLQNNFDAICFYLKVPFHTVYKDVFKELQILAVKAKLTCNYDMFIYIFIKFNKEILSKIQHQGVDQCYSQYIQNGLYTLLNLWGCRICHFKEFFNLFKSLFTVYSDKKKILQLCLKHNPNLNKQDIALIRANYRQNIENKKMQFLTLLKQQKLQEINAQLNSHYHRVLYNLDFLKYKQEQLVQLLTLVNGNSNIEQFFMTVQKAFKQWNYTIDFYNYHKFIESQFKLSLNESQALQSLRLFTNLCILQGKGYNKQFSNLVSKGSINKIFIGMIKFLLNSPDTLKLLELHDIVSQFVLQAFKFLQKTMTANSKQWEDIIYQFSGLAKIVPKRSKDVQDLLCSFITKNLQHFHLGKCLSIFKRISQNNLTADCKNQNNSKQLSNLVVNLFMKESVQKSKQINYFRFFGKEANKLKNQQISAQQAEFLKKYAHIQNGFIEVKDNSCLKLSQLEVITNPIQFEKALDSYYFSLDSNSKRFVQYVIQEWSNQSENSNNFFTLLIKNLIQNYPVCLPILCNVRINLKQNSNDSQQFRYAQSLVNKLLLCNCQNRLNIKGILFSIMNCDKIKYRNGKDYMIEQIVPMILKRTLNLINGSLKDSKIQIPIQMFEILTQSLRHIKLSELKIDTIQKSILKLNYQIANSKCQKKVNKLSNCSYQCMKLFFKKKQLQIKKAGLTQTFQKIIWNQIRTYHPSGNSTTKKQLQNVIINDHLMVSPYTLSQEYNLDEYKIKKCQIQPKKIKQSINPKIKFENILSLLPVQLSSSNSFSSSHINNKNNSNNLKCIDLSQMEYDIAYHLGIKNLELLQNKENIQIKQKFTKKVVKIQQNIEDDQKSYTFVQYYIRQMTYPQISQQIALKNILSYFKSQIQISYIWTNPKNLQKIFLAFIILYDFLTIQNNNKKSIQDSITKQNNLWKQIITYVNSNIVDSVKKILKGFSEFGYNNLWGQNYKTLNLYGNIRKILQIKQIQDQSYLSVVLKRSLQFSSISQIKIQLNLFLDRIFTTRPPEQTSLMYKVGIDKNLLNLIMKSLEIQNLNNISFLFHSNFNNLRLYTDQLHQGLKALNMASKTRSYNQYIQLAKQIDDQQFLSPMKLFQQNFRFFIKIQKQGYNFKKSQEIKLALQRLANLLRNYQPQNKQVTAKQCDKILVQYLQEMQKLELNIANRVKSFYLVTKLRDLSYQNSISISLIKQVLNIKKTNSADIIKEIKKIEIFTLIMSLYKELVLFGKDWQNEQNYNNYNNIDHKTLIKDLSLCTTRRFSHSMNKVYQKCDLELDQIIQRCFDELKLFLNSDQGKLFINQNQNLFYPPFLVKNFLSEGYILKDTLINKIKKSLQSNSQILQPSTLNLTNKNSFITEFVTQIRSIDKKLFLKKDLLTVNFENKSLKLQNFIDLVISHMKKDQTLVYTKSKQVKFLTFNKYKTSQPTLQAIEALGYLIGYFIYHKISFINNNNQQGLPLHNSILAALNFNIADIDDVLDIDFKIWQDIKRIMSLEDSKTQNLNFSYLFENLKTLQQERIELVDKGASKKVNNLNRAEYCDSIACHILYKNLISQMNRLLQSILGIVPKQLLSSLRISQFYPLFYNKNQYELIFRKYMKKIGIVTPQIAFKNGQRIQNLKDYQNIQWAIQVLLENNSLRQKLWKEESNLFIVTTIGNKGNLQLHNKILFIYHFQSKNQMLQAFKKL